MRKWSDERSCYIIPNVPQVEINTLRLKWCLLLFCSTINGTKQRCWFSPNHTHPHPQVSISSAFSRILTPLLGPRPHSPSRLPLSLTHIFPQLSPSRSVFALTLTFQLSPHSHVQTLSSLLHCSFVLTLNHTFQLRPHPLLAFKR